MSTKRYSIYVPIVTREFKPLECYINQSSLCKMGHND
nr:MAG TPA: hypothetical protein [Caudoviricetes sp.]